MNFMNFPRIFVWIFFLFKKNAGKSLLTYIFPTKHKLIDPNNSIYSTQNATNLPFTREVNQISRTLVFRSSFFYSLRQYFALDRSITNDFSNWNRIRNGKTSRF